MASPNPQSLSRPGLPSSLKSQASSPSCPLPDGRGSVQIKPTGGFHFALPTSEELAYREFFGRYQPPIFGLARNRGLSRHDAEDVVQEVMLAAWRHLDGTVAREGCEHFRGLVLRMAGNKTFDHLRRQRAGVATESLPGTGGEPIAPAPDPEEVYERKVELTRLAACLEQCRQDLAPRTFDAFRLYVLDEVPATETAATLEMSVNQVYVTRHQVTQRLRRLMPSMMPCEVTE